MSKHIDKAKALRNNPEKHVNCAQTLLVAFADDLGLSEEADMKLGSNFGGGMKMGSVCGTITSGAMILGMFGMDDVRTLNMYYQKIKDTHDGLIYCADLLKRNAEKGGQKKPHCDSMIYESIGYIEEILHEKGLLNE